MATPEDVLRALVEDMTKHFKGQYEPNFVGLARAYIAALPKPQPA